MMVRLEQSRRIQTYRDSLVTGIPNGVTVTNRLPPSGKQVRILPDCPDYNVLRLACV